MNLNEDEIESLYNLVERRKYLAECPKPVLRGYMFVTRNSKTLKKWVILCGSYFYIYASHSDMKSELQVPLHVLEFET